MDDRNAYFGNENYGVIYDFLRGQRPDWEGRWLADIRTWNFQRLEDDHHYIQWLFPLLTESESVFAPILRPFELSAIRNDGPVQGEMVSSLRQMLGFYGFELKDANEPEVVPSQHPAERKAEWLTTGNHNYRRISRILRSLALVGLKQYATSFLRQLECLYGSLEGQERIDSIAIWHWRQSVTG